MRLLTLALLAPSFLLSQNSALAPYPIQQPLDNSGRILGGSCIYTYTAGTTTPQTTYSNSALTVANTNPIVLNSFGRAPAIYMSPVSYKFVLAYPTLGSCPVSPGNVIWSQDNVFDPAQLLTINLAASTGAGLIGFSQTGSYSAGTVGAKLLQYLLDGNNNVAMALSPLPSLTTGTSNVAIGAGSMASDTTGGGNVAIGNNALAANTIGGASTAVGDGALQHATSAQANTGIGFDALVEDTLGIESACVGYRCLQSLVTGNGDTSAGAYSLEGDTAGTNTAVGYASFQLSTTGDSNVGLGYAACLDNLTGSGNICIGAQSGEGANPNTSGNRNTYLGAGAVPGGSGQYSNQTLIGAAATDTCSSCVRLGRAGTDVTKAFQTVTDLGGSYQCTHGSNATCGIATLSAGTVTVSTSAISTLATTGAGSVVQLTLETCSSCGALSIGTVSSGSSFVINSTDMSDGSAVYWEIRYIN